ncbi:MAG: STAS domain-containing protein [Mycobacteriaceae bacterium]|nr:STAS domain-containing protein [Mycobacteriaceae bacterium]
MNEAQFRLTGASGEQAPIVTAAGDIDLANVNEFQETMAKAANGASALTVDLSEVSYCDSAAVRALFSVAATAKLNLIIRSNGPIKTLLSVSGLDHVATVTTIDE